MSRLILLALLIIAIAAPAMSQESKQESLPAHGFTLRDLNGKTVRLNDYKGKVVLLNFWATWCIPCRAEIPDLVKLQKEYQSRGLQVIGVTYPDYSLRTVQRMTRQLKVNYPILLGTRQLAAKYGVGEILPVTVIVDREGIVRGQILGIMGPEEFEQSVKPLLDK